MTSIIIMKIYIACALDGKSDWNKRHAFLERLQTFHHGRGQTLGTVEYVNINPHPPRRMGV